MYEGFNTIDIYILLFFYFLQIPISKSKVYLFFFEKVIGKIGISYFTYRKMQPSNQMGIVRDCDSMGCKVLRDATISQEIYQRTKCLTHEHQIHLWKERLALNQSIQRQRKELATLKHLDKITQDDDIVRIFCKKLEVGGLLTDDDVRAVNEE